MTNLKALAAPRAMKIHKKDKVWVIRPSPGPHALEDSVPMGVLLRDYLKLGENLKEIKYILHNTEVLVDGRRVKAERFPLGLLDQVSIPKIEKYYIMLVDSNARLYPKEVIKAKIGTNLCKLVGKTVLKGGKIQLNLYDGKNVLVDAKDSKKYTVGGTLVLKVPEMTITGFMERAKGKTAIISKGRHSGRIGTILDITESKLNLKSLTTIESEGDKFTTDTDYIFVVGEKEPMI